MGAEVAQHPACLSYALSYARRGWPVFPLHTPAGDGCSCGGDCGNAGKHPRTQHGLTDATTDEATIRRWWQRWPDANVAIATGERSGLLAVDIDPRSNGTETWTELVTTHDPLGHTPTVATGGGGTHLFLRRPDLPHVKSKAGALGAGVDVKADGGYVVAPPSLHASGEYYRFRPGADPGEAELEAAPQWLVARLGARQRAEPGAASSTDSWLVTAFREAGWLERKLDSGAWVVRCPWLESHTTGKEADSSTVVLPATELGEERFHCSHAHCTGRTAADVRAALPEPAVLVADERHPLPPEAHLGELDDAWIVEPLPDEPLPEPPSAKPVTSGQAWERLGARTVAQTLRGTWAQLQTPQQTRSVSMCHRELDQLTGGFVRGLVTVLGAVTSWGKTSYALMVADEGLRAGERVLYVSGEDHESICGRRLLARRAGVSALRLREGVLRTNEHNNIAAVINDAEDVPWFLDAVGKPAEWAAKAAAEIAREGHYGLLIFDYLQAFTSSRKTQDRRNEVTAVARCFADAAKSSGAAGLILSQLKRREFPDKPPTMHDLKESGDVENMAEVVLLGHLDHRGTETVAGHEVHLYRRLVAVGKNKDGPRSSVTIHLPFDDRPGGTASFQRIPT
jgi:hypothetical protein